jgi:Ca2+-binding RTX toxin-like protein
VSIRNDGNVRSLFPSGPATKATAGSRARRGAVVGMTLLVALSAPAVASARVQVGSPGPDRLKAGPGGDLLFGGGGADTLIGGAGNDVIYGVRSGNRISGGGGDDYIEGGAGSDKINGGAGNNTIYGGSGHDEIAAGDGNNYVDVGGAPDRAELGDGNNVLVTGSGGGNYTVGDGNNTVYYGSGIAYIKAGKGVNTFYLSGTAGLRSLNCGGNPASVVYVNAAALNQYSMQIFKRDKAENCPTVVTYDGITRTVSNQAGKWESFSLRGTDGRDKLFGGHGGGTIDAKDGDDIIWADFNEDTGGAAAQANTTTITAGNGNKLIYGGRGTNNITAGNGNMFIRGGAWNNTVTLGAGNHVVRLQGYGQNEVTLNGAGDSYVEAFANGHVPSVHCNNGAQATIVYGNTKPNTNCDTVVKARSKKGMLLQVERTPAIADSDAVVDEPIRPGQGAGVARPNEV